MKKTFLVAVLLYLVPSLASAQFAPERVPATPQISTSGESTVYVTPNLVEISAGIEAFDASLDKAKSIIDTQSQRLLKAIKEAGVEQKNLQTDAIDVSIEYENGNSYVVKGYVARRSYIVKITDVKMVESLVDTILKNGATHLFGIDYQTTELRKYRDEARKMAIKAAKEKAQLLAGELEMDVKSPRQISEASFWYGYYGGSSYWGRRYGGNAMSQNSFQAAAPAPETDGTMPMGQIAVRAQVNVTFDMEAKK